MVKSNVIAAMVLSRAVQYHCPCTEFAYGWTYFANRSQPSVISAMPCITGLIFVHIAVSIGTFVLSCSLPGESPWALDLASAALTARDVGSGTPSPGAPSPDADSPWGCLPGKIR
jgi:hypothetical protein